MRNKEPNEAGIPVANLLKVVSNGDPVTLITLGTELHSAQFSMATYYHRLLTNFGTQSCRMTGMYAFNCYIKREVEDEWRLMGITKFHLLKFNMPFQGVIPPEVPTDKG